MRAHIRELMDAGALGDPSAMPTRALSPAPGDARTIAPCVLCRESEADTAFFDRAGRAEVYAHMEPCARLWLEESAARGGG